MLNTEFLFEICTYEMNSLKQIQQVSNQLLKNILEKKSSTVSIDNKNQTFQKKEGLARN